VALAALGCYAGSIDGIIGSATTKAIIAFQTAVGLKADGIYGTATAAKALADVSAGKKICTTTTTTTSSSTTTSTAPKTSTTTSTTSVPTTTTTTTTAP